MKYLNDKEKIELHDKIDFLLEKFDYHTKNAKKIKSLITKLDKYLYDGHPIDDKYKELVKIAEDYIQIIRGDV
jgi:hypothetical protein